MCLFSDEDEQVLDPLGHLSEAHRKAVEDLREEVTVSRMFSTASSCSIGARLLG